MSSVQSRSLIPAEVAAFALVAVVVTWLIAAPGSVPQWESATFEAINGLPDWMLWILWPPMQLGALIGAAVVATVLALRGWRPSAPAYVAASGVGWLAAVIVKQIVERDRPLGAGLDVVLRASDASGFGFISGHTTVAFAGATVIWVFYSRRLGILAYAVAAIVGVARMYVGAHLPLDVIGGAAAGTIVGGLITWAEMRWVARVNT